MRTPRLYTWRAIGSFAGGFLAGLFVWVLFLALLYWIGKTF